MRQEEPEEHIHQHLAVDPSRGKPARKGGARHRPTRLARASSDDACRDIIELPLGTVAPAGLRKFFGYGIHRHAARDVTRVLAAYAVTDHYKSTLSVTGNSIFVLRSRSARVGHGCHQQLRPGT